MSVVGGGRAQLLQFESGAEVRCGVVSSVCTMVCTMWGSLRLVLVVVVLVVVFAVCCCEVA